MTKREPIHFFASRATCLATCLAGCLASGGWRVHIRPAAGVRRVEQSVMSEQRISGLSAAILAGGQARRMGHVNKALVTVGGVPVIDRLIARLAPLCDELIVIAADPEPYAARGLTVHPDIAPGNGALGGMQAALTHARGDKVFVCGCDMPLISPPLIHHLNASIGVHDAAVPRDGYGLQPLHAIYARRIAPLIAPFIVRRALRMEGFIDHLDAVILPPPDVAAYAAEAEIFFNVNTPADLEQARLQAREAPQSSQDEPERQPR
jgi:molybdopterin-guanine dinucleotide biosynthesis protein A